MTRAVVCRDGARRYLRLDGHATGSVEVCNMISGLVCTLAGWLRNLPPEACRVDRLDVTADKPGYALLEAEGGERMQDGFDFVVLGLVQLQNQYPELVQVEIL